MDESLIKEYLSEKRITIIGEYFHHDKNITHKDIVSQINLMVELHKILVGCCFNGLSGIKSTIGKEIEDYKVQIKKLERYYYHMINQSCSNDVDRFILANGKTMLKKAKEAVNYIYEHDYFGVIKRSMNREELCLGKVQPNNLRRNEDKIEIGMIKDMTYNLVEEDLYNYIKKLQRSEVNMQEEDLIKVFIYESHLSFSSFDYLRGICSYPRDFLKAWMKYMEIKNERNTSKINRKNKTNEELLLELEKSLKYESKNFIKYR